MRIQIFFAVFFLFLLVNGCKKTDDSPANPNTPVNSMGGITPNSTPVLDTSKNILLINDKALNDVSIVDDSTLSVTVLSNIKNLNRPSQGPLDVTALHVNDVLVSGKNSTFLNGLLAKVSSIQPGPGNSSIARLVNIGVDSLYKKLDFDWKKSFDTLQTKGGFNVDIPVGTAKLNVQGSYQLFLTSGVSVLIEDAKFKKAECKVEGDVIFKAKSTLNLQTLQKDTSIVLNTIPLFQTDQLTIGKIQLPFVLSASLTINLKVKASGTMQLSASYDYRNITYVGLVYDGSLKPEGVLLKDSINKMDMTSKVAGSFSAGLEAKINLGFFKKNKTGLTGSLSINGILEGNCAGNGLTLTGKRTIEGDIGGQIELFSSPVFSGSVPIYSSSTTLFTTTVDDGGICSGAFPPATGKGGSHGDAHIWTPDNRLFDFQSFGEFTVLKDDQLLIQARQGAINTDKRVTFNKAVAVSEGPDTVEFQVSPLKLYVQGKERDLSQKVFLSGRGYVEASAGKVTIRLSNGDYIAINYSAARGYLDYQVGLSAVHKSKLAGLMGNWDGNAGNDLLLADGSVLNSTDFSMMYPAFANSWRISNSQSLFYYEPGKGTQDYTDYSYPSQSIALTAAQIASAQNACSIAGVHSEPALNNCIIDVGVMGDPVFAESALAMQDSLQLPDPVVWLPLDGDAKDKSPYGNDGKLMGKYNFTTNRRGQPNSALALNGQGWVDVPNTIPIKNLSGTVTVSGWINIASYYNSWAPFICKSYGNQNNPLQIAITATLIDGSPVAVNLPKTLSLNTWHHIAMVLNNGQRTYYVDGTALTTQNNAVSINDGDMLFGSDPYGAQEYLTGALDDLRVYNRVLTAAEIAALRNE